jgi:hypothetical protein
LEAALEEDEQGVAAEIVQLLIGPHKVYLVEGQVVEHAGLVVKMVGLVKAGH